IATCFRCLRPCPSKAIHPAAQRAAPAANNRMKGWTGIWFSRWLSGKTTQREGGSFHRAGPRKGLYVLNFAVAAIFKRQRPDYLVNGERMSLLALEPCLRQHAGLRKAGGWQRAMAWGPASRGRRSQR